MAPGERHSHDYPLGTSWAGSNCRSPSTLHPRPYSPCPIVRGTYSYSTWRSLGGSLAGGCPWLRSLPGPSRLTKTPAFSYSFQTGSRAGFQQGCWEGCYEG